MSLLNQSHENKDATKPSKGRVQNVRIFCKTFMRGWQAWLFPVEVGCRGFPAKSVWRMFTAIGLTGKERKIAVCRMGETAERAPCWF